MTDWTFMDLLLLQSANCYDLRNEAERQRSANDLSALFYALQDATRPDLTIEVGAFEARFSATMRGRGIRAIAFEANPYNYAFFRGTPALTESGVEYLHAAVGNRTGTATFRIQHSINGELVSPVRGNNSIFTRSDNTVEYKTVEVAAITLDEFFRTHGLLGQTFSAWIDVEGGAYEVLEGARNAMQTCVTAMVEVEDYPYWVGQKLFADVMSAFMDRNFVPVARDFEYDHQYNLVFVRRDLLQRPEVRQELTLYHVRSGRGTR